MRPTLRFKVDEDLPREVTALLRGAGYDAISVADQSLGGTPDEDLWPILQNEGRCLITADKGFANAQRYPPGTHAGILLLRLQRESRRQYADLMQSVIQSGHLEASSGVIMSATPHALRVHRA